MTISTSASQATFLGNGVTNPFSFNFIVGIPSNFIAYYTNTSGVQTLLPPNQYTLTLNPPATGSLWGVGGTILYPTGGGSPIANGTSLFVDRVVPITQTTSISNQGTLLLNVIETALDTLCLEIQQVSGRTGQIRGTWTSGTVYGYGDVVQDGAAGADTLNYYMCANANTSGTWSTDLAAGDWVLAINVQQISGYATAAAASAAAALVSQNAAASSATASAASAATATTQAGTATTQATNASNSASSASTSATTATTQAGIATTQAGIATTQATNASASAVTASTGATTATTQAGIATTQATNASTSATAAAASAVLAGSALSATSTTSLLIGTGSKTFTTQANKNFFAGQFISAASNANATNYMHGQVTSYSGTTLVINVLDVGGSGTLADWNIAVSGTQGAAGSGTGTVTSVTFTGDGTVLSSTPSSAVTTSGTVTGSLKTQTANTILSGPTSGGAVNPTFRALVAADIPSGIVALTSLATQAADTFLANATNGAASPTAVALAASQLAGRGSSGDIAAISLGTNISMTGTTLNVAGGSELVLLATATASASSALTFTSLISSSYSQYLIVFAELLTSTTSVLNIKFSTTNGSSYTETISSQLWPINTGSNVAPSYAANTGTSTPIAPSAASSTYTGSASLSLNSSSNFCLECFLGSTANGIIKTFAGPNGGGIINAFEIIPSAGTLTSGKVYFYGIKNT